MVSDIIQRRLPAEVRVGLQWQVTEVRLGFCFRWLFYTLVFRFKSSIFKCKLLDTKWRLCRNILFSIALLHDPINQLPMRTVKNNDE